MILTAIVAMTGDRVIGRDGDLPWRLGEDLKFFKEVTMGHPILMGRKTYESIGRALPGRRNLVLSRREDFEAPGCEVLGSVEEVSELVEADEVVWVIGGAGIYEAVLGEVEEMLVTHVRGEYEGDTVFPEFEDEFERVELVREREEFEIVRYRRKTLA